VLKYFFQYGEKVDGYDILVLNEREARAAAAILFLGAFIGLTNGVMLGTPVFSKFFVTFFAIDFTIRIIQPRYAPSLLLGRFFVQNQIPEYVGASQKRFAWALGFILAWPMFYYLVIDFQPNPLKIFVCLICMTLLFFEAAFSICLGCKIYAFIKKQKASHCPGGVCEMKMKEPLQKFSSSQKIILLVTIGLIGYGVYAYFTKLPDRTPFMKKIKQLTMTQAELEKLEDEKAEIEFEKDDW
jgi:hypothetical protein